MEYILVICFIGLVVFIIIKLNRSKTKNTSFSRTTSTQVKPIQPKIEIPIEIKVTTSANYSISEEKFKPIHQSSKGGWILNPGAPFELTLNSTKEIAQKIRNILDDDTNYGYRKTEEIVAVFSEHNISCYEVEEYRGKYRNIYLSKIEQLKQESDEWKKAFERDKEDILESFRAKAIAEVYEKADCDLVALFEDEPSDFTIDDELIKEYGFDNIQTYLRGADKMDKIHVYPSDHYYRPKYDKLVELNLAERGYNIPKNEILTTLTLKELNAIAQHPEKEFKRKNPAIEYILTLPNLDEKIGKSISLRELFKLKPLPEKYSSLNLSEIAKTWNYSFVVANLVINTYQNSYYSYRDLQDKEYVKGYKVIRYDNNDCPCAKDLAKKSYLKNNPPKVPCHIGCNCHLEAEFNF
jgi:hypothetical protein